MVSKRRVSPFAQLIMKLFFISIFFLYPNSSSGKIELPLKVRLRVDKDKIYIGDKFKLEIIIWKKRNIEIKPPEVEKELKNFSLRDFGLKKRNFLTGTRLTYWYILDTYSSGSYKLGPFPISFREKGKKNWNILNTSQIKIKVESLLKDSSQDIRDIKGPLAPSSWFWLGVVGLISGLGLFSFFLYKRFFSKAPEETVVKPSASEIALRRLKNLKEKGLIERGQIKDFYIELSDIVRHYIEGRFKIRAPEMTTEEFLLAVKDASWLKAAYKSLLGDFLKAADLVKFARYGPSQEEIASSLNTAERFIRDTQQEQQEPLEFKEEL